MVEAKSKILFVYSPWTTFTKTDYDILAAKYDVVKYQFKPVKGNFKTAREILKQLVFLLINIWQFKMIYIWFADSHSFLPVLFAKILQKKSFLVIGGYDVARISHLNYGVFTSKLRGFFALYSMNHCSVNLSVSKYVDRKVKWLAKKVNTELIYNCITLNRNSDKEDFEKENLIITVGIIEKEQTYYIKGIDTFIEIARQLPQYKFLIVGLNQEKLAHLLNDLPANITIKGRIPHEELIAFYQRAKIYCQLSRSESFGVALAEAMYFGCIPVVTNIGGLPEIVNDKNLVVTRNLNLIRITIDKIFKRTYEPNADLSEIIYSRFSVKQRSYFIHQIIEQIL
ncbi:glycosyltransferase family 4 protein [Draconibacterium orientale]|uniref:glycosyltransferase family 4 protein n=1 Tax=Draconibacterium orientale TaxID=1168034 RepID=UPI002ABDBF5D|nr:glycosyltransferase family 4 protein [Draconibacterium orientale]